MMLRQSERLKRPRCRAERWLWTCATKLDVFVTGSVICFWFNEDRQLLNEWAKWGICSSEISLWVSERYDGRASWTHLLFSLILPSPSFPPFPLTPLFLILFLSFLFLFWLRCFPSTFLPSLSFFPFVLSEKGPLALFSFGDVKQTEHKFVQNRN